MSYFSKFKKCKNAVFGDETLRSSLSLKAIGSEGVYTNSITP